MKQSASKSVKIIQPKLPEAEVSTEILTTAIVSISESLQQLLQGRLKENALLILIHQNIKPKNRPSVKQIKAVLDSMSSLKATYIR